MEILICVPFALLLVVLLFAIPVPKLLPYHKFEYNLEVLLDVDELQYPSLIRSLFQAILYEEESYKPSTVLRCALTLRLFWALIDRFVAFDVRPTDIRPTSQGPRPSELVAPQIQKHF